MPRDSQQDIHTQWIDDRGSGLVHGTLSAILANSSGVPLGVDKSTRVLDTIEYEHHEIYAGSHFYLAGFKELGNGDNTHIDAVMPNNAKWQHLTFEVAGSQGTTFEIFEDAILNATPAGTGLTAFNNNRNTIFGTSVVTLYQDAVVASSGTLIYPQSVGAGRSGGFIARDREIVLKQGSTYIFRFTNQSASDNIVNFIGEWYEHTNKT